MLITIYGRRSVATTGRDRSARKRKHPSNDRLRWARLQRGWGLGELARQIKRSMAAEGEPGTGLTAETVRRWEIGDRVPAVEFRKHLVMVLGHTADELGLLSGDEMALRPAGQLASPTSLDKGLVAGLVAETVRQVLDVVRDERGRSDQRALVGRMLGSTAVMSSPAVITASPSLDAPGTSARRTLDRHTVGEFARITGSQNQLYFTADAEALLDAVLPHLRLGIDLLVVPQVESSDFRALARSVAQTALLAARMAFFDLADGHMATDCFTLAARAVEASGDHALSATVCAHQAFVPGFAGKVSDARALLDAAHAHVRLAPGPRLRSWLHCVSAEIAARFGDAKASLNHIRQAEQALSTQGEDPAWLDFFDESRWAGFAGQAYLLAGKAPQSAAHLKQALCQLSDGHKQRSVLLLDLAAAQASSDAAEAAGTAHQALDALAALPYATAVTRLPQVAAALRDTPFSAELQERIRALPSAAGP